MTSTEGRETGMPQCRSDQELESAFRDSRDAVVRDLFLFVTQESYGGQLQSGEPVTVPKFNFYVRARRLNGTVGPNVAFEYRQGWDFVRVFLNWQKYQVPEEALTAYRGDLNAAFGSAIDITAREPAVTLSALGGNLQAFKAAVLRFRDAVEAAS